MVVYACAYVSFFLMYFNNRVNNFVLIKIYFGQTSVYFFFFILGLLLTTEITDFKFTVGSSPSLSDWILEWILQTYFSTDFRH